MTAIDCGCMVPEAMSAAETLEGWGVDARVINMHTIKLLDRDAVLSAAAETGGVDTAEEHLLTGGHGGAVAELLAEEISTRMRFVGMSDEYSIVGPTDKVRDGFVMSVRHIVAACQSLVRRRPIP